MRFLVCLLRNRHDPKRVELGFRCQTCGRGFSENPEYKEMGVLPRYAREVAD